MAYTNEFFIRGFEQAATTMHELVDGLDDLSFRTPPAEGKWCVGEIMSHLLHTGGLYLNALHDKLDGDTAHLARGKDNYTHGFFMRFFIKAVSPENTRKLPTVAPFEPDPVEGLDKEKLLSDFDALQQAFIAVVEKADREDLDLSRIKIPNPVYPMIKMPVSAALAVQEAHQRRHLEQIRAIAS